MPISATYFIYCIIENGGAPVRLSATKSQIEARGRLIRPDFEEIACRIYSQPPMAQEVSTCVYKDIAAVVREVDIKIAEELNSGSDTEQVKNWLVAYQQTNIAIFRHRTMLPLRFGVMVDRKEEVEGFLASNYLHLKWALEQLRGVAEFAVQLTWDINTVLGEISRDKQWLSQVTAQVGNLHDKANKVEVGQRLFEAAERKKAELVDSVHRKLLAVSLDNSEGRYADGRRSTPRTSVAESMSMNLPANLIMNRSYLIEQAEEETFDRAVMEWAEASEAYLHLKYVGPIPPYSFAPLEFKRGNFELIDEARKTLKIPERASLGEIKAAYRRLSLKYHPDKNPDDPQAEACFKQVHKAYNLLNSYCVSYEGADRADRRGLAPRTNVKYAFTKKSIEKVFIVER
jgi:hypothetical protein